MAAIRPGGAAWPASPTRSPAAQLAGRPGGHGTGFGHGPWAGQARVSKGKGEAQHARRLRGKMNRYLPQGPPCASAHQNCNAALQKITCSTNDRVHRLCIAATRSLAALSAFLDVSSLNLAAPQGSPSFLRHRDRLRAGYRPRAAQPATDQRGSNRRRSPRASISGSYRCWTAANRRRPLETGLVHIEIAGDLQSARRAHPRAAGRSGG